MSTAKANRIKIVWIEVYSLKNISILNSKGKNYSWNGVLIVDISFGEWSWSKYVQGRAQQTKKTWSKIEPHPIFFHKPDPISSAQNEIHVKNFARNWKEIPNFFDILEKAKKKSQKIDQNICSWEWKSPEKNQNNPLHCWVTPNQSKANQKVSTIKNQMLFTN